MYIWYIDELGEWIIYDTLLPMDRNKYFYPSEQCWMIPGTVDPNED